MTVELTWKAYERGLLERLRYEFSSEEFRVEGTVEGRQHRIVGRHSGVARQLDAAVYQAEASRPFFIADAKFHEDPLDVGDVDAFVGLMGDVGAITGLLAAPKGPSPGAIRRAAAAGVTVWVMSLDEALTGRWLPEARQIYRWDRLFHHDLALALRVLDEAQDASHVSEVLEGIFFEEWDAFFEYVMARHPDSAVRILGWIARHHADDAWTFNAARILIEHDALAPELREFLAHSADRELRELLENLS